MIFFLCALKSSIAIYTIKFLFFYKLHRIVFTMKTVLIQGNSETEKKTEKHSKVFVCKKFLLYFFFSAAYVRGPRPFLRLPISCFSFLSTVLSIPFNGWSSTRKANKSTSGKSSNLRGNKIDRTVFFFSFFLFPSIFFFILIIKFNPYSLLSSR